MTTTSQDQANVPMACISVRMIPSVEVVTVLHSAGFDALYVDLQDTDLDIPTAATIAVAAKARGMTTFVRVANAVPETVRCLASAGVEQILVTGIHSASGVERLFSSLEDASFVSQVSLAKLGIGVMVESVEAINDINNIVRHPLLRFVMIGCTDLASSARVLGINDALYIETAIATVATASREAGVSFMVGGTWRSQSLFDAAMAARPHLITVGSDSLLLQTAARNALSVFANRKPFGLAWQAN